jgi:hypothetical protein
MNEIYCMQELVCNKLYARNPQNQKKIYQIQQKPLILLEEMKIFTTAL